MPNFQEDAVWLSSAERSRISLTLATGEKLVSLQDDASARYHGTAAQLRAGEKPGLLVRSSALVMVEAADATYFLLTTDEEHDEPGKWRFPCVYLQPGELPLAAAQRALTEQFDLFFGEEARKGSWSELAVKVSGETINFLTGGKLHELHARCVQADNTLEFYYPMQLKVVDIKNINVVDRLNLGRRTGLFSAASMLELSQSRDISTAARTVFGKAVADGTLSFVRTTLPV